MNKPIEDWMLTAYVFGDLDDDQLQVVENAIARDPGLQSEVDEIRATVTTVGKALHDKDRCLVSDAQLLAMRTSIASALQQDHAAVVSVNQKSADIHSNSRVWWFGLSALAASGLIALTFGPGLFSRSGDISFTTDLLRRSAADERAKSERGSESIRMGRKDQSEAEFSDVAKNSQVHSLDFVETDSQLRESEDTKSKEYFAQDAKSQVSNGHMSLESLEKKSALGVQRDEFSTSDAPAEPDVRGLQLGKKLNAESLSGSAEVQTNPNLYFDSSGHAANGPASNGVAAASKPAGDIQADAVNSPTLYAAPQRSLGARAYGGGGGAVTEAAPAPSTAAPMGPGASYGSGYAGAGGGYSGGGPAGGAMGGLYGGKPAAEFAGQVPQLQSQQQSSHLHDEVSQADGSSPAKGDASFRYRSNLGLEQEVASDGLKDADASLQAGLSLGGQVSAPNAWMMVQPEAARGDRFEAIQENEFQLVEQKPVTTFSVDVDTASYSKIRQVITGSNTLPNPNAVRVEEMINYFSYDYPGPVDNQPFAAHFAAAECPWNSNYKLMRIALQAKKVENKDRPLSNIVFLLDVSGSMDEPNKLPLVKKAIRMLVRQLGENDRVAIVVYAGAAGCVLPSTSAVHQERIMESLDRLSAGGSTNGGQGIELAYQIARENFIKGGVNRIILCTDGDFNVGTTNDNALVELVVQNAKAQNVFMTCLGFGQGNMNDAMMEKITNKGNGFYAMVDGELEARRIMVEQINATLVTVAKDVKIQVEFNPNKISAYRQIGYEDRKLENRDFNDDSKDAGEIGAGHRVTVLYEIVPTGVSLPQTQSHEEPLKYSVAKAEQEKEVAQEKRFGRIAQLDSSVASELLTVKLRYKKPEENVSTKIEFPLTEEAYSKPADQDFRWASSMAQFGMLLRHSKYATNLNWNVVQDQAAAAAGNNESRLEAVDLVRKAKILSGANNPR